MVVAASFAVALYVLVSPGAFAASAPCGPPPKEWREHLDLDHKYNVSDRAPMPKKDFESQAIFQFNFENAKGPQTYYHATSWGLDEIAQAKLGPPAKMLCGQRLQSHSTVFVWDPTGAEKPFYIKQGDDTTKVSALFNRIVRESGVQNVRILPETQFARLNDLTSLRREVIENPDVLPLHGFLGSPLVDKMATAAGLTREQWIEQVYLKKLAGFFSTMHFKLGFHHASHSQNLLIELDRKTGDIKSFVVRDHADLAPDYFKIIMSKTPELAERPFYRALNNGFFDEGALGIFELSNPGVNFGAYGAQSVVSMEPDFNRRLAMAKLFLEEYIDSAERDSGSKIKLTKKAQDAMRWLKKGDPYAPLASQWSEAQGALGAAFSEVVQSVNDTVARDSKIKLSVTSTSANQNLLRKAFDTTNDATDDTSDVAFIDSESARKWKTKSGSKDWSFAYDGNRIYAIDESNSIVATTFGVAEEYVERIKRIPKVTVARSTCPLNFALLNANSR